MADGPGAGPKAGGIPEWQKNYKFGVSDSAKARSDSEQQPDPQPQETVVSEGSQVVEGDKTEATTDSPSQSHPQDTSPTPPTTPEASAGSATSRANSNGATPTSINSMTSPPASSSPAPPRDIPPIITYPEFLLHAQKPPPIITAKRLINTAYVASAVGTAFYLASKYLFTPMIDSLTEARHDLAQHTQTKLDELNLRLGETVSADAAQAVLRHQLEEAEEVASVDSDPTELFHRDFGTQTGPSLMGDGKASGPSSSSASESGGPRDVAAQHTEKLDEMTMQCTALTNSDMITASEDKGALDTIKALHDYLHSLAYPVYTAGGQFGAGNAAFGAGKEKDDEIARFRSEIRSVKGTLLSARNFPATVRRAGLPQ